MKKYNLIIITLFISFLGKSQLQSIEIISVNNIQLSPDTTYSRSIKCKDSTWYAACSNGSVYLYDTKTQKTSEVFGYEVEELRDIELLGNGNVLAMMSGSTGKFVKIGPGSRTSTDKSSVLDSVFLDGMDFSPSGVGVLMGDPVDGSFSVFFSNDFGSTWEVLEPKIKAEKGEAGYAASGTNIQLIHDGLFYFVSGGSKSRLYKVDFSGFDNATTTVSNIPMQNGEGKGAFSLFFKNEKEGIVVGGDYKNPDNNEDACFFTYDGGETWTKPTTPFSGYKSCVIYSKKYNVLFASGRTGLDYSLDFGENWIKLSDTPMFALTFFGENLLGTTRNGIIMQIELKFI